MDVVKHYDGSFQIRIRQQNAIRYFFYEEERIDVPRLNPELDRLREVLTDPLPRTATAADVQEAILTVFRREFPNQGL